MNWTIRIENPLDGDDVRDLVAGLNAHLFSLTPPELCFHMTPQQMAGAGTTVFVTRDTDGRALGMGALRRHANGVAEVKRMYTLPTMRGQGVGSALLATIERLARAESFARLVLETGDQHPDAYALYEKGGFTRCGAVLDYPDAPTSVFYEKRLASDWGAPTTSKAKAGLE